MNDTMINQQVTTHQLAWLAGIWDGEGTFTIINDSRGILSSRLSLSNTDVSMINEIVKIFDLSSVKGHIWQEQTSRKPNHKKAYHITINKMEDVLKITEMMLPYLISKKPRAELLIRFVKSRMKYKKETIRDPKTGHILGIKKQGYSKEEKSLFDQMRELNTTGIKVGTSETLRQTFKKRR
jgi:hypothetical protein